MALGGLGSPGSSSSNSGSSSAAAGAGRSVLFSSDKNLNKNEDASSSSASNYLQRGTAHANNYNSSASNTAASEEFDFYNLFHVDNIR